MHTFLCTLRNRSAWLMTNRTFSRRSFNNVASSAATRFLSLPTTKSTLSMVPGKYSPFRDSCILVLVSFCKDVIVLPERPITLPAAALFTRSFRNTLLSLAASKASTLDKSKVRQTGMLGNPDSVWVDNLATFTMHNKHTHDGVSCAKHVEACRVVHRKALVCNCEDLSSRTCGALGQPG
jgi:hypothetical protein